MTALREIHAFNAGQAKARRDLSARAEALGAGLPDLLVNARRIAWAMMPGAHGRRRKGPGDTFWQFRQYQFGDPAHQIDWRQSARSDRAYIREREWEVAQSVWIWRDGSPSMQFASGRGVAQKVDRASLLAVALGVLLVRGGERIAVADTDQMPVSGPAALLRMADTLSRLDASPKSAYEALVARVRSLPRHSRVVLIGDFLQPAEETERLLKALVAQRIRGHMLRIIDPAEETLPYEGRVMFDDPETVRSTLVDWVSSSRPNYLRAWSLHGEALRDVARTHGWTIATHHTNRPAEEALLNLYLAVSGANPY